jgi:hypothetical protein
VGPGHIVYKKAIFGATEKYLTDDVTGVSKFGWIKNIKFFDSSSTVFWFELKKSHGTLNFVNLKFLKKTELPHVF